MYNTNKTNITVEKIDTICTDYNYEKKLSEKKLSEKQLSEKQLSEKQLSEKQLSEKINVENNTIDRINNNLDNIKTCLHESELIVNKNSSESIIDFDTEQLLDIDIKNDSDAQILIFKKTNFNYNNYYLKVAHYVKKNRNTITNTLYDLHIIKNKNIPFRILFHIFINYINQDIEIIFD